MEIMTRRRPRHRASATRFAALCTLALSALSQTVACVEAPPYYYAEKITGARFSPLNDQVGVYPDLSVMGDPHNPFRALGVSQSATWEIEASGDPVAGFYAWATRLSVAPMGEAQFYAALNMRAIYERGLISQEGEDGTAREELEELTRSLAVKGFQAVLDHFPDSVTYDVTGEVAYGLATLAYQQLIELNEPPRGGWSLVSLEGGGGVALRNLELSNEESDP